MLKHSFAPILLSTPLFNAANAVEPFKPDATPNCNLSITKGAQKSLNEYAILEYNNQLDNYKSIQKEILSTKVNEYLRKELINNI